MSIKEIKYEDIKEMDVAALYKAHSMIVELIKVKNRERELRAGSEFRAGDIVKWDSTKAGRVIFAKVDKINPKSLIVQELAPDGTVQAHKVYRVSPSLCSKSTVADAIDAMKPKVSYTPPGHMPMISEEDEDEKEEGTPIVEEEPAVPSDPTRDVPDEAVEAW